MKSHDSGSAPAISVVLPVLNGLPYISDQLDAIAAQEVSFGWEVIVADNGSTDGTQKYVEQRAASFPVPLRVVDASGQRGVSHARNVGVRAAMAPKFAICDSDDVVMLGWLNAAHEGLDQYDFITGKMHLFWDNDSGRSQVWGVSHIPVLGGYELMGCTFGGDRCAYLSIGGMDESLTLWGGEDTEFSIRVAVNGYSVGYIPDMSIRYRQAASRMAAMRKWRQGGRNDVAIWRMYPELYAHRLGFIAGIKRLAASPMRLFRTRSVDSFLEDVSKTLGTLRAQLPVHTWWSAGGSEAAHSSASGGILVVVTDENQGAVRGYIEGHMVSAKRHMVLCLDDSLARVLRPAGCRVLVAPFGPGVGLIRSVRTLRMAVRAFRPTEVIGVGEYARRVIRFGWYARKKRQRCLHPRVGVSE